MWGLRAALRRVLDGLPELWHRETKLSWSQEGEDVILRGLFPDRRTGFYVDVGAHHPRRFSNTHGFYRLGWRGINIDAMPGSMEAFRRARPRDINLETGISEETGVLKYYVFNDGALNTFDSNAAKLAQNSTRISLSREVDVPTVRLEHVLDQYLTDGTDIDFMSIDVEGLEIPVLRSSNWVRYRPKILLVECHGFRIRDAGNSPVYQFLSGIEYAFHAKTTSTLIFAEAGYAKEIEKFLQA